MTKLSKEEEKFDSAMKRAVQHENAQLRKMCPRDQDPVLTVLRIHLLTEHYLERLLAASLPRGDRLLDSGSLSYAQKLVLVDSLDVLQDEVVQCLKGLNRVRNSCAHEMEREITIPDIERIGRPLGSEFTSLRQQHYPDVKALLYHVVGCLGRDLSGAVFFAEVESPPVLEPVD